MQEGMLWTKRTNRNHALTQDENAVRATHIWVLVQEGHTYQQIATVMHLSLARVRQIAVVVHRAVLQREHRATGHWPARAYRPMHPRARQRLAVRTAADTRAVVTQGRGGAMTPAEAVAKVLQILSGRFPPGYFHEPERVAGFVADDGALCGLVGLTLLAADLCTRPEEGARWAVVVEVEVAVLPHRRFGYCFSVEELAGGRYDDDTWRASWLFALVRAVERERGIPSPVMEEV